MPFTSALDDAALIRNIENFSEEDYLEKVEEFFDRVELIETGKASRMVAQKIQEVIDRKTY